MLTATNNSNSTRNNSLLINSILLFVLIAVILIPRLPALDTFVTVDESTWLMRSGNFYYALGQREYEKTIYAYHPAVTTMWTGAAAIMLDFPEYRGMGQGYFEKEVRFSEFLIENSYHPLEMLRTSRQITVTINTCLIVWIYFLLRRLFGWFPAFTASLLFALDPFLLGHTRILAHEGMMSLLIIGSILAFLNFLFNENHPWLFIITSAIAAALAVLTKSSATIILPFIGLLCVIDGFQKIRNSTRGWVSETWEQFKHLAAAWGSWLLLFMVALVLIWPGMWVNPAKMLFDVYGNAFSYVYQGYNLEYAEALETPETDLEEPIPSGDPRILNYAYEIPWRTTPVVWAGLFLSIILIICHKFTQPPRMKQIIIIFLILALLFLVMMSLAKGRLTARYIMVTFSSLGLVASLGIGFFLLEIRDKLSGSYRLIIPAITFIGLLTIQAICAFKFYPYYFNYSNPILEIVKEGIQTPVVGYGEGLELAAEYIAQKPRATNLTVMSWYGIGPFSFFYPGQTENMYPSAAWTPDLIERLARSDFLVVYQYHQQRRNMPAKLLEDIAHVKAEYTIWLNGVEYVRIYPVSDLPDAVFVPDPMEAP